MENENVADRVGEKKRATDAQRGYDEMYAIWESQAPGMVVRDMVSALNDAHRQILQDRTDFREYLKGQVIQKTEATTPYQYPADFFTRRPASVQTPPRPKTRITSFGAEVPVCPDPSAKQSKPLLVLTYADVIERPVSPPGFLYCSEGEESDAEPPSPVRRLFV